MFPFLKQVTPSNQMQLNMVGVFILGLLGFSAWAVARPLTWYSVLPLLCIGYAVFRVVFELTFNRANVPTLATCFVARHKIAAILQHEASLCKKETYTVIDLGSGCGELTRCIAKKIPNAKVTGIEMAPIPYMLASLAQRWRGPENLFYKRCDFWPFDCSDIDAVVIYLTPRTLQRAGEKLHREMKHGSIVISYTFPLLGAWEPIDVLNFRSPFKETIYVYRQK